MVWKIFYEDGSTFASDQGDFLEAPAFGVIALVVADETEFRQVDLIGLIDLATRMTLRGVKVGRMTTNEKYAAAIEAARSDPSFGVGRVVMEKSDYYVRI